MERNTTTAALPSLVLEISALGITEFYHLLQAARHRPYTQGARTAQWPEPGPGTVLAGPVLPVEGFVVLVCVC
ncbi:MAG: hypothetical protein R2778_14460 [Saprospiraceae bacterium]